MSCTWLATVKVQVHAVFWTSAKWWHSDRLSPGLLAPCTGWVPMRMRTLTALLLMNSSPFSVSPRSQQEPQGNGCQLWWECVCVCVCPWERGNKPDISYLKTSQALNIPIHSIALQAILSSVGVMSSCLLLVFPLSVSLMLLHLHCLCFSVSQYLKLITVLDYS